MSLNRLYNCIKSKKINYSEAREALYMVLINTDECLSVAAIVKRLNSAYHRKVSLNTIYRHLTLFVDCGLVVVVQDDYKKAYYTLTGSRAHVFTICPKCNDITILKETDFLKDLLGQLDNREFMSIHKKCQGCK